MAAEVTREPILLLLPGMTLNATIFPDLGLPSVSPDFTRLVISQDGSSPELARRRMDFYVDLLVPELQQSSVWQTGRPRIVIGHSFGGMLALQWLITRGQDVTARVDGLILMATTAGPMFDAVRMRLGSFFGHELRVPVRKFIGLWNHRGLTRVLARLLSPRREPRPVNFRLLPSRSDLRVGLAGWVNTDWRARRSFRLAMDGFDVRSRLSEVRVPTIVLHGSRDTYFPLRAAEELARGIPGGRLKIVKGAAHLLPLTHPHAVREAVEELLSLSPDRN